MQNTSLNEGVFNSISEELKIEIEKILIQTNLLWDVKKEDLISETGLITPSAGIFRMDTNKWLGTTSKKYTPYQNSELVLTIHFAGQKLNLKIVGGGENYEGKRVYLLLELPSEFIGNSKIERFITAVNYHNGLGSVGFGSTNKILNGTTSGISSNNFFRLYPNLGKFRHCSSINERISVAISQLFQSIKEDNEMMAMFNLMANTKLEDSLLSDVMSACYGVDLNNNLNNLSTRQFNKITAVSNVVTQEVQNQENSVWGLFNGILKSTEQFTPKNAQKDDFYMAGQGYSINMKAYSTIFDYLEKNKAI